jgi:hypothetical protein
MARDGGRHDEEQKSLAGGADGGGSSSHSRCSDGGQHRLRYAFHVCLCWGMCGLGTVLCMLGPTLLDLGEQAHASVQQMSYVFTARSVAYLLGSVVGGLLLEVLQNTCTMLALAMYLVGIGSFCAPLCTAVWSLGLSMACAGFAMGLIDTGANVMTLKLWGPRAEPFVQSIHASFALGALVAPLLADQYIRHGAVDRGGTCGDETGSFAGPALPLLPPSEQPHGDATLPMAELLPAPEADAAGLAVLPAKVDVRGAFWLSALAMLPSAIGLSVIAPRWQWMQQQQPAVAQPDGHRGDGKEQEAVQAQTVHARGGMRQRGVLVLGLLMFAIYVGAEIGFGGYVFTYAVLDCNVRFGEGAATRLTAVYWAMCVMHQPPSHLESQGYGRLTRARDAITGCTFIPHLTCTILTPCATGAAALLCGWVGGCLDALTNDIMPDRAPPMAVTMIHNIGRAGSRSGGSLRSHSRCASPLRR